jgi:hypothetical protein
MIKKEKLILIDRRHTSKKQAFKVKKVINTTQFRVGQYLSEQLVEDINLKPEMTIELVDK